MARILQVIDVDVIIIWYAVNRSARIIGSYADCIQ